MDSIRTASAVRAQLERMGDAATTRQVAGYFKTGPGDYGAGDLFRGIRVPALRRLARNCDALPLGETLQLLRSRYHEDRLLALLVMVRRYERGDAATQRQIAAAYLANRRYVNNWDLVDSSAPYILGAQLYTRSRARLHTLARSPRLWDRRIAILATHWFVRQGEATEALRLARLLLRDREDLMHKAVGWTLREVGARCGRDVLRRFLERHADRMPRTMLRYAIEHFAPAERRRYLARAPQGLVAGTRVADNRTPSTGE